MSTRLVAFVVFSLIIVTGCANVPLGAPAPVVSTVQAIKNSGVAPVAVGTFKPGAALKPANDKTASARGSTVYSPVGKSFAAYLGEMLKTNLAAAGSLDNASGVVLSGELTKSELSSASSKGTGVLSAKFTVKRDNQVVYDQLQTVEAEWESSFMGAIAIPRAFNEYGDMYRKLVEKLFTDASFIQACKAP